MLDLARHWAHAYGDRPALVDVDGHRQLSYWDVNQEADTWATLLGDRGVRPGDRVSLLAWNDVRSVTLFLGCLKVGAALVPHNLRLSPPELERQIRDLHPRLVVKGPGAPSSNLPVSEVISLGDAARSVEGPPLGSIPDWERPSLVLFTGGSTGVPKGALLSLRALLFNAWGTVQSWGLGPEDATVLTYPLFHTGGWNVLTLPLLATGGRVYVAQRLDPSALLGALKAWPITVLSAVPAVLGDLVQLPDFPSSTFPKLRWVKSGGGMSPPFVIEAFRQRNVPFYQGYGLTEAGPNLFYSTPEDLDHPFTVGRPALWSILTLRDERGEDCEEGELWVSGPLLFSGYTGDPDGEPPPDPVRGWPTGDILRRDPDGFYYFVGRRKLMYKSGGENVYPSEVELALESHPAIVEAAVVGVPDAKWGEAGIAFYRASHPVSSEEIRTHLRSRLAHFKVPREFIQVPEIPRTPTGKKDYLRLAQNARGGTP
jgi:fatty-acyl-CoA synthase